MFEAIKEYGREFLEPVLSGETHDYHFGKHHIAYVNNLNNIADKDSTISSKTLVELIKSKHSVDHRVYNNASQIWNHDFYWKSLAQYKRSSPSPEFLERISRDFVSLEQLQSDYKQNALGIFGSGWSWLVFNKDSDSLEIFNSQNSDNPLIHDHLVPLLTIDVWEHAYYIDYRNDRGRYLDSIIMNCLNWQFAENNMSNA